MASSPNSPRISPDSGRECYVALVDILGFKELVAQNGLKVLALALRQIGMADHYPHVKSLQFSDSILPYTDGAAAKDLRQIVGNATLLIRESLERRIGLWAGIRGGQFLNHRGVFLGPAMVRAYELEQMQDWIGGIVDPHLTDPAKGASVGRLGEIRFPGSVCGPRQRWPGP
jgi:hypothetical protein